MKRLTTTFFSAVAILVAALAGTPAHAAGFQHGLAADPSGPALVVGVWYPSRVPGQPISLGPTAMTVALDAPVDGSALPLVVMSHGTGGSFLSHFDTAIALADAGFVVVAMNHTGDNYADQSRSVDVIDRPRQVSRVIDHMLSAWPGHAALDAHRIGVFGFSSGGLTALASVGGRPDFSAIGPMCSQHPGDFACLLLAKRTGPIPVVAPVDVTDARIKAAVVAAPALGFTFLPDGLRKVELPVQLWRAENDTLVPHPRYAEAVRLALPAAPEYHVGPNAGHFDFLAPCSEAMATRVPSICTSAAGFDRAAFHVDFDAAVVRFFGAHLAKR
jgi:predicted dienelactone hydrolase